MGRWRGFTLGEAMAREPSAVDAWLADALAVPHVGESPNAFISRIGGWLDTRQACDSGRIVAAAEPSVLRGTLVYALKAPPSSSWNMDIRPVDGHGRGPGGPLEPAVECQDEQDGFGEEPSRDELQGLCGHPVQPLGVVDHA